MREMPPHPRAIPALELKWLCVGLLHAAIGFVAVAVYVSHRGELNGVLTTPYRVAALWIALDVMLLTPLLVIGLLITSFARWWSLETGLVVIGLHVLLLFFGYGVAFSDMMSV